MEYRCKKYNVSQNSERTPRPLKGGYLDFLRSLLMIFRFRARKKKKKKSIVAISRD